MTSSRIAVPALERRLMLVTRRALAVLAMAASIGITHAQDVQVQTPGAARLDPLPEAREKLRHVIIIMQENRSFDHYFGTFPGADGIPPNTCVPIDPKDPSQGCVAPFHNPLDVNAGGPHGPLGSQAALDDGITQAKMDGFIAEQLLGVVPRTPGYTPLCPGQTLDLRCTTAEGVRAHDVMGYHTDQEISNYWRYAKNFVLQDHMFSGWRSWSFPSHVELTSEWVARCTNSKDAQTCSTAASLPLVNPIPGQVNPNPPEFPWVSLFQLLDAHQVSWKYYVTDGTEPDCEDGEMTCAPQPQHYYSLSGWNPAPYYSYVKQQGAAYLATHLASGETFLKDLTNRTLPQVSWIVPDNDYSEHPPSGITMGMMYVTSLVNAVMTSPYWNDTAVFIAWDDYGGFYDHVAPPNVDMTSSTETPIAGYGLRVPGLLVSAYARQGVIDHNVLSFDAYATFIEDLFMDGARLDPTALGNPDSRPDIRDALTEVRFLDGRTAPIGKLIDEFDFSSPSRPPLIMTTHIPTGITAACNRGPDVVCRWRNVTVSWNAVTAPGSSPFTYGLKRDGHLLKHCDPNATRCVDAPGSGAHVYRVFSIDAAGNRTPLSAGAQAVEP